MTTFQMEISLEKAIEHIHHPDAVKTGAVHKEFMRFRETDKHILDYLRSRFEFRGDTCVNYRSGFTSYNSYYDIKYYPAAFFAIITPEVEITVLFQNYDEIIALLVGRIPIHATKEDLSKEWEYIRSIRKIDFNGVITPSFTDSFGHLQPKGGKDGWNRSPFIESK